MIFNPWNNHGVNLAQSIAKPKLIDPGDCNSSFCNHVLNLYQPFKGNASKAKAFIPWETSGLLALGTYKP